MSHWNEPSKMESSYIGDEIEDTVDDLIDDDEIPETIKEESSDDEAESMEEEMYRKRKEEAERRMIPSASRKGNLGRPISATYNTN
jgi:hypothetical protein